MARTALAPLRSALARPLSETSRYAGSFESNLVSQVTSRDCPSAKVATARSCTASPGLSTLAVGVTSSLRMAGSDLFGPGKTRPEPGEHEIVFATSRREHAAALMRRAAGCLAQDQAFFGVGGVDAPAVELARDPLVVLLRRVTAQRQSKAVLTGSLAMACTGIAAHFGEKRNDLGSERRRGRLPGFGPARERERNHTDND